MYKYLYGKKQHLSSLIDGSGGIRLSDLAYYSIMENDQMRDNELEKEFVMDKDQVRFEVNGFPISPLSMASHPVIKIAPSRCFCVCFSGKKNASELFDRFNADVCLELDIGRLVDLLKVAASKFEGMEVIHGPVNYYPDVMSSPPPDLDSCLFYKRDMYAIEDEYRIALTIPPHRKRFKGPDGTSLEIFSDDPKDVRHMFISWVDPDINLSYISSVFYL